MKKYMKRQIAAILLTIKKKSCYINKPYYYKFAQKNIQCDCPLCKCPSRNRMQYSFVYICENRNLIYYDIPKCASTTIRKEIFKKDNDLSLINPEKDLNEYLKFTFVRNPWDRMVSNWKMFTTRTHRIKKLNSMTSKDVSKFEDFVYFANRIKNHHWQPQVLYLPDKLDFIGKVESFNEDLNELFRILGERSKQLPRLNVTARRAYWEYYTPSLIDFVAGMYSEDIKEFGYEFDPR